MDYVANILTDQPWVTLDSVASLELPATLSEQLKADILRKRPLLTQVVINDDIDLNVNGALLEEESEADSAQEEENVENA